MGVAVETKGVENKKKYAKTWPCGSLPSSHAQRLLLAVPQSKLFAAVIMYSLPCLWYSSVFLYWFVKFVATYWIFLLQFVHLRCSLFLPLIDVMLMVNE